MQSPTMVRWELPVPTKPHPRAADAPPQEQSAPEVLFVPAQAPPVRPPEEGAQMFGEEDASAATDSGTPTQPKTTVTEEVDEP
eukprot:4532110-Prymnesium_polylepis.1